MKETQKSKPKKKTKNETSKKKDVLIVRHKQNETWSQTKRGNSSKAPTTTHHLHSSITISEHD